MKLKSIDMALIKRLLLESKDCLESEGIGSALISKIEDVVDHIDNNYVVAYYP